MYAFPYIFLGASRSCICGCVCDRCLLAGGRYDLQVVFRLFQLWFTLGTHTSVNTQLATSFREVPSYKLLSLVYQIASRMSAATSGPYYESGFQVLLILVMLAKDHLQASCLHFEACPQCCCVGLSSSWHVS